jgi:RimJ/RimL family protein N-acetyltransferase
MEIEYRPFTPGDAGLLADFLTGEVWPYHGSGAPDRDAILRRVADGHYGSGSARTFWIMAGNEHAGLIWLFDLDDGTPMFDLRIRAAHRGRGLGGAAVGWLTGYLFSELPGICRIEATTRQDNEAMRRRSAVTATPRKRTTATPGRDRSTRFTTRWDTRSCGGTGRPAR